MQNPSTRRRTVLGFPQSPQEYFFDKESPQEYYSLI